VPAHPLRQPAMGKIVKCWENLVLFFLHIKSCLFLSFFVFYSFSNLARLLGPCSGFNDLA
jgi:hypothetical protein